MNFSQLTECMPGMLHTHNSPLLMGEAGIGKSSWVKGYARTQLHSKCFTVSVNQLADKADLTGERTIPKEDENGNPDLDMLFCPHPHIKAAVQYAKENPRETPVLFLDEINRTTPDITSACLSLITDRRLGTTYLPDNLILIGAGNDRGNIIQLDSASISRFIKLHVTPDVDTFLANVPDIHPAIKNVLLGHPDLLVCTSVSTVVSSAKAANASDDDDEEEVSLDEILDVDGNMDQITTPRTLEALSTYLNNMDPKILMTHLSMPAKAADGRDITLLQEMVEGFVGPTSFTVYLMEELSRTLLTARTAPKSGIQKPAVYDSMKLCPDMTSLSEFIENLSERERGACLVYALYEKVNNTNYIRALAPKVQTLDKDDLSALTTAVFGDQLDAENCQTFLSTNSPLSQTIGGLLSVVSSTVTI